MAKDKETTQAPAAPPTNEPKLQAMCTTIAAIAPLARTDQVDVLRAVANFFGLVIVMEPPR